MKNILLLLISFCFLGNIYAQFQWAEIGVSGLTCSACSRSVEMSLLKIPFVDSVEMNLEHTQAKVFFNKISVVEIEKLAQAVIESGFSVAYLKAEFIFNNVAVSNNYCFSFENNKYQFLVNENKILNARAILVFIGDKYLPKKEIRTWKPLMNKDCASTNKKEKLYYVTL